VGRALGRRPVGLGQQDGVLVGAVLGEHVHPPQVSGHLLERRVGRRRRPVEPQHQEAEGAVVAPGAIDLGAQPLLEVGGRADRGLAAQPGRDADHRDRRPDRDLVAGGDPGRPLDPLAVDPGPVPAAEVLDRDLGAAAHHPGVVARRLVVVDRDRGGPRPPEGHLDPIRELDDARPPLPPLAEVDDEEGAVAAAGGRAGEVAGIEGLIVGTHPRPVYETCTVVTVGDGAGAPNPAD
jgi:hypothetical protein